MAWVSPTFASGVGWLNSGNAYDDNTGSYAYTSSEVDPLELTHSALYCDKVRIYARDADYDDENQGNSVVDIDVYYSGGWHEIYSGVISKNTWVEKAIGSTQSVTKAKVLFNDTGALRHYFCEFDFGQVLKVETDACTNVKSTSFDANGDIVSDGGLTVTRRGFHYSKVFDGFEWGSDTDPLDDSGGAITWTVSTGGTSSAEIDEAQYYSGTRSVLFAHDGANHIIGYFPQSALSNSQVWFTRFRKDNGGKMFWRHGNGSKYIVVRVHLDEKVQYYDGSYYDTGTTVSLNTWQTLTIQNIDWDGGTYDIYLDGILIQSDATMGSAAESVNICRYWQQGGNVWLDEVAVWDVEDESNSYSEGEYSLEITGLDPGTTYYVQALAENADGIAYGDVVTVNRARSAFLQMF